MAYGEVDGVFPGTVFKSKQALADAGVHSQVFGGMAGGQDGTESIVLNEGYVDDEDRGETIIYTGHGGQDDRGHQVRDQVWHRANEGMRANQRYGIPVRVIRGPKLVSPYAPPSGYRYDGLYRVERCWQERSKHGPLICRFELTEITEPGVQERVKTYGLAGVEPGAVARELPEPTDEMLERIRRRREQRRRDR